jgi:hypothetical protein
LVAVGLRSPAQNRFTICQIALTYQAPEDTPDNAKYVSLQLIMNRLEKLFPTFTITKETDADLGRRLAKMEYQHKRSNKGSVFKIEEI